MFSVLPGTFIKDMDMDCTGLIKKDEFMETVLNAKVFSRKATNSKEAKK